MADHEASKINHENHYLLDQPLLRLPYELLRQNFRFAHLAVEKESQPVKTLLKTTATTSLNGQSSADDVLRSLDTMLGRMRGLKSKLAGYAVEEERLQRQLEARVAHLAELVGMNTVEDVKYEAWSRRRLDRLLVDYMLRNGYDASAAALADEREMRDLVDVDTFVAMSTIRRSLEHGSVVEALAWCADNKKELRKMDSNLEFMLRCQQYVEMLRTGSMPKMLEAIAHARKFIIPYDSSYGTEVSNIGGLLAHQADTTLEPYASWYSPGRWRMLADLFVRTHNTLLGLPSLPLLHIALSSGLSALKTPACHSSSGVPGSAQPSHSASLTTNVCPICSTELNELARGVPYAHHGKSHVEHDLVLLPNGRAYGRDRLDEYAIKAGLAAGRVKDLVTGEVYADHTLKKVFIT